jgi:hypothetical protein
MDNDNDVAKFAPLRAEMLDRLIYLVPDLVGCAMVLFGLDGPRYIPRIQGIHQRLAERNLANRAAMSENLRAEVAAQRPASAEGRAQARRGQAIAGRDRHMSVTTAPSPPRPSVSFAGPVVELRGLDVRMARELACGFHVALGVLVQRDAGGAERMVADVGGEGGRLAAALDDVERAALGERLARERAAMS